MRRIGKIPRTGTLLWHLDGGKKIPYMSDPIPVPNIGDTPSPNSSGVKPQPSVPEKKEKPPEKAKLTDQKFFTEQKEEKENVVEKQECRIAELWFRVFFQPGRHLSRSTSTPILEEEFRPR